MIWNNILTIFVDFLDFRDYWKLMPQKQFRLNQKMEPDFGLIWFEDEGPFCNPGQAYCEWIYVLLVR